MILGVNKVCRFQLQVCMFQLQAIAMSDNSN